MIRPKRQTKQTNKQKGQVIVIRSLLYQKSNPDNPKMAKEYSLNLKYLQITSCSGVIAVHTERAENTVYYNFLKKEDEK